MHGGWKSTGQARARAGDTSNLPGHGSHELEPGEPNCPRSPSDRMRDAGPLRRAAGSRACHSNQPASLVVGRWES